jgi:dTDP-glucose 4,6-dehydratase
MKLPLYGNGEQVRDWIYVKDNCRAILAVLNAGAPGSIYNIAMGEERTNLDIVRMICAGLAQEVGLDRQQLVNRIEFVQDRPGHDRRYALNPGKIRQELEWAPLATFELELRSTIRWYLEHKDWISGVTSGKYRDYYESVYLRSWGKTS